MRSQLEKRGTKTVRGLSKVFRNMDSYNGNKLLDADEFFYGLKEIGVNLSKQECKVDTE